MAFGVRMEVIGIWFRLRCFGSRVAFGDNVYEGRQCIEYPQHEQGLSGRFGEAFGYCACSTSWRAGGALARFEQPDVSAVVFWEGV